MKNYGNKGGSMRAMSGASLALIAMLTLGTIVSSACSQVGVVQARRAFKQANMEYQAQNYPRAAELYEEALQSDPNLVEAYFYLGNSYDNQWKPSRRGEPENDALMDKAVENYQTAAEKLATATDEVQQTLGKRSLEYLQAAYGADKLNDPAKAEPIVQRMIQLEPGEPSNYFVLAKIYEDAGAYPESEEMLINAREVKPNDPAVYMTLAGFYNRQGEFEKTIEALEERAKVEPNNPEAFQTIAAYYWDETRGDAALNDEQKRDYLQKGLEAVDHALQIRADYVEALTFKGLLLRLQANLEKDPARQQALIKEAVGLSDRANDLRKQKTAGTSD